MKTLYEVECQRTNVTPRDFYNYCVRKFTQKATSIDFGWIDNYEYFRNPIQKINSIRDDWKEICRCLPYNFQFYLRGSYNVIIEFEFDTETTGHGYFYAVEYDS